MPEITVGEEGTYVSTAASVRGGKERSMPPPPVPVPKPRPRPPPPQQKSAELASAEKEDLERLRKEMAEV